MELDKFFEKEYLEATNKEELDYWGALATIISQFWELLRNNSESLTEFSKRSGISEEFLIPFESIEKIPTYDEMSELCQNFGHKLFISLYGDFSTCLDIRLHHRFKQHAKEQGRDPQTLLTEILNAAASNILEQKY